MKTWKEQGIDHQGLEDFSPHTQDLIAVDIIRSHNAIDLLVSGNLQVVVEKLKYQIWTSLKKFSYREIEKMYKEFGGAVK